jgi:hypothetical protein
MDVEALGKISTIKAAVREGATATGVDFNFLMRTAQRESGLSPTAHASTSTAAGLFQFVEQTWLSTLKRHGPAHGYARYADLISTGADGRFYVPQGEEAKRAVMDLRYDPHAAAVMAGELVSDSAAYLRGRTGREPTGGELYAAHFLGPQGSARLIEAIRTSPEAAAASMFPDAAGANRDIFYHGGRALTVSELYANLSRTGGENAAETRAVEKDPGQSKFAAYAGAARAERLREEQMMVNFILTDGKSDQGGANLSPDNTAVNAMFSADMLRVLAQANATPHR